MSVSRVISASVSRSAAPSTAPDGLCGELIRIMRVRRRDRIFHALPVDREIRQSQRNMHRLGRR